MTYRLTRFIGFCYKRNTNIIPDHMVMCYEFERYETVFISISLYRLSFSNFDIFFSMKQEKQTNKSYDWSANVNCESAHRAFRVCARISMKSFCIFTIASGNLMENLVEFINVQHGCYVCLYGPRHRHHHQHTTHLASNYYFLFCLHNILNGTC